MDRIGVVYAARPNKRTSRLCEKIKTKELWVLSKPNKTRDMTDRIGVVYAARRQRKTGTDCMGDVYTRNKTQDMTYHIGVIYDGGQN